MAGGTWIDQNKVRPGVYINYSSVPSALATMGERGVVCIGKVLNWGVDGKVIEINDPSECFDKLGYDQMSNELIWFRQLLVGTNRTAGASKVLVWKLAATGAAAATGTQEIIAQEATKASATYTSSGKTATAEAVTAGADGNKLSFQIVNDGGPAVKTFMDGELVETSSSLSGTTYTGTYIQVTIGSGLNWYDVAGMASAVALTGGADAVIGASLTATAQCTGTRGNDITVIATPDPDNSSSKTIFYFQTLVDGKLVDTQTLKADAATVALSGLQDNGWVKFTTTGNAFATSLTLSGGLDGTQSATAYSDFLTEMELKSWNIIVYGGTDSVTKSAVASFVKRLANDEGKKVQACVWDYPSADSECVISVYPQHITDLSGHAFTDEEMTCWVGGASAGANVNESLTYAAHPDAATVNPVLTSQQQIDAINAGQFALIDEFGSIKNLQDNNTFTTFAATKGKAFRKNRVIRTVFGLCNDIYMTFSRYYIGNTNNDEFGRDLLKGEILNLMNSYQGAGALQNVETDDVTVSAGTDSDAVLIELNCQPVDSIEKIYINITIS